MATEVGVVVEGGLIETLMGKFKFQVSDVTKYLSQSWMFYCQKKIFDWEILWTPEKMPFNTDPFIFKNHPGYQCCSLCFIVLSMATKLHAPRALPSNIRRLSY